MRTPTAARGRARRDRSWTARGRARARPRMRSRRRRTSAARKRRCGMPARPGRAQRDRRSERATPERSSRELPEPGGAEAAAFLTQRAPELALERGPQHVQLLAMPRPCAGVERPAETIQRSPRADDLRLPLVEAVQHRRARARLAGAASEGVGRHRRGWRRRGNSDGGLGTGPILPQQDGLIQRRAPIESARPAGIPEPERLRPAVAQGEERKGGARKLRLAVRPDRKEPPFARAARAQPGGGPSPLRSPAHERRAEAFPVRLRGRRLQALAALRRPGPAGDGELDGEAVEQRRWRRKVITADLCEPAR